MVHKAAATVLSALFMFSASGCGDQTPPSPSSRVSVALDVESQGCDAAHPIAVHLTNVSKEQIDGVEFVIRGQEVGHSTFLANSGPLKTDKIMAPGEVYSICAETPMVIRPAPANLKWNYTVEVENVWGGQKG